MITHCCSMRRTKTIVWTMLSLMVIIGMCVDLVAPSLPAIASGLAVSKTLAKNTISIYLLGYALGNFTTGFLTDAWGRRKLMRLTLFIFVIASLLPIFFANIDVLLFARLWQGLAIGAVSVLLRAICSDLLSPHELTQLGPWFGTMWGLGPVLGPILGGYLQTYYGWQAGFYFFSVVSTLAFLVVFFILPETSQQRHPLRLKTIKVHLAEVFKNAVFIGITILMGLTYSLLIGFNVAGPFLIQTELHYSPLFFGHIAFYLGIVFLLSTLCARYLVSKVDLKKIWIVGIHLGFLIVLLFLSASFYLNNTLIWIVILSGLMFSLCGFLFPASLGKGLSLFRHIAGTATAVMYLINIGICSVVSYSLGFIHIVNFTQLSELYFVLMLFVVIVYWGLLRRLN